MRNRSTVLIATVFIDKLKTRFQRFNYGEETPRSVVCQFAWKGLKRSRRDLWPGFLLSLSAGHGNEVSNNWPKTGSIPVNTVQFLPSQVCRFGITTESIIVLYLISGIKSWSPIWILQHLHRVTNDNKIFIYLLLSFPSLKLL